jgi:hypothetical protein
MDTAFRPSVTARLSKGFRALGFKDFKRKYGYEYLDYQLWSNVKRMKGKP